MVKRRKNHRSSENLRAENGSSNPEVSDAKHTNGNSKKEEEEPVLLADQAVEKKWKNWWVRTTWTLIMIGGFFMIIASGHLYVVMFVMLLQNLVFKEVISLSHEPNKERKLPWFRALYWYSLLTTNYFLYGESIIYYFKKSVLVDAFLLPLATYHRFISFMLYCFGFVWFVTNLKKGHYKFQFKQFAWTHMALLLVCFQSHFIINNIFEGMIWFFLPVALVICNDIFAYIFGFFFGRTPLIKLSPKKTVEGFIGGWISTVIFAFMFSIILIKSKYMCCPADNLSTSAFSGAECELNPAFIPVEYKLKPWMFRLLYHLFRTEIRHVYIAPLQLHAFVMASFASLIAPFGGFFASGLKRAFNIKDFGDSIPGHGGITDRMDCQFLMGFFAYIYYQSFIKSVASSSINILQDVINNLSIHDQLDLYMNLQEYFVGQGILPEKVIECTQALLS
ncbi:phosphatidate cytidylyltransferase [Basidiobolus ranarum]|uniref:Phosphatidate cytidylyltransferase n=1 Tax=Basidiobolus ranarum TaxID=34480 RepID=A0ABR2VW38_9FUNG